MYVKKGFNYELHIQKHSTKKETFITYCMAQQWIFSHNTNS